MYPAQSSEESGESTIGKTRHKRAPEGAHLLPPLRARLRKRNVGIEAAAICQQVSRSKQPIKAAKGAG
jgi:hypothetical protein